MDSLVQPPARKMELIESPDSAAFEAAAPLVECALKTAVSIPASPRYFFIHLPIVLPVTAKWGALRPMSRLFPLFSVLK